VRYNLDAAAIAPKLISLLAIPNVTAPDSRWLVKALQLYRSRNTDFGDALLCAYAHFEGCGVATFDKGILKRFPEIATCTPTEWLAKNP
jgi:predicted nucleic-acid-binding protein